MSSSQTSPEPTPSSLPLLPLAQIPNSSLKPCSHLLQVLNSNAKDTVLRNYGLAVKVSHFTNLNSYYLPTFKSNKGSKSRLDRNRIMKLKSQVLKCKDCHNGLGTTFMCLQCSHVGCLSKRHFVNHAKLAGHIFGIDGQSGHLFCFKCGDYTGDAQLESLRQLITGVKLNTDIDPAEEKELIDNYSRTTNYKPTTGLRGFVNMGSTCFMSSVVQTIVHNPIIRNYFMSEGHMFCPSDKNNCITCAIDEIFTSFYTSTKTSGFGPVSLLNAAWKINKSLAGYSEQDAHEFWQFLVNQLHQDLTDYSKNPDNKTLINHDHRSLDHSSCLCIIHKTFSTDIQSAITCSECGNVRNTVDMAIDISLGIKYSDSLTTCFENFTKDEKLEIKYNCSICQQRTSASKRLSILKFPNVLSIQLKRFEHNSTLIKLENYIKFPMFMNMSQFSTQYQITGEVDPSLTYELFAVVCHIGSVNTGHYVTVVKSSSGEWFKFDDSVVTAMSAEQVVQLRAYLLFYIVHKLA